MFSQLGVLGALFVCVYIKYKEGSESRRELNSKSEPRRLCPLSGDCFAEPGKRFERCKCRAAIIKGMDMVSRARKAFVRLLHSVMRGAA